MIHLVLLDVFYFLKFDIANCTVIDYYNIQSAYMKLLFKLKLFNVNKLKCNMLCELKHILFYYIRL